MKKSRRFVMEIIQSVLSAVIVVLSLLLVLDWKTYEFCFCIVFGLAIVLFLLLMIHSLTGDRRKIHVGRAAAYLLLIVFMIALFTGSLLVIIKG